MDYNTRHRLLAAYGCCFFILVPFESSLLTEGSKVRLGIIDYDEQSMM